MLCSRRLIPLMTAAWMLALVPAVLHGQDAAQSPPDAAAPWIDVLKSDAPVFEKAMACRRLAAIGSRGAVPALAALLADEKLSTYARSALEAIPGREADDALREAAGRLQGDRLIGVLGSIGKRRDASAIDLLAGLLDHQDRTVAAAAAKALGHIGNVKAAEVLHKALSEAAEDRRSVVAVACLICAEKLPQPGDRDLAMALCDAVRRADVPKHVVLAATHRAIVARDKDGLPLLAEQLRSEDEARFRFALQAARDLGAGACGPLTARFDEESAARQVLLILALSDLGDRQALPVILAAARQGAKEVRIHSMGALPRFGDPAAVPVLLRAAVEPDADIAGAARAALAALQSEEINAAIAEMLDSDDDATLQVAIQLAGQRNIASAAPALLKLANSADASIRLAAIRSLGSTVSPEGLQRLIALAIAPQAAEQQLVAQEALKTACARLPRETCSEQLAAAMAGASSRAKVSLLEQLAAVGGTKALATVVAAARSHDDAMQDAATRLLGGWMTADAAPKLFDLAKTLTDEKYRIRALRGYVRIARQLKMTPEERLEVCRNALAIAERDEERRLALEALGRVGSPDALALAASRLDDADLQEAACTAVVAVAERLVVTRPAEAEKALQRAAAVTQDPQLADRAKALLARARRLAAQQREEADFLPLFDGKTLEGWEGNPAVFRVEDGAVVGGSLKKPIGGNDFLCTKREYGDFELRLQFKLLGEGANGGVNLRSQRDTQTGVARGYQADLGVNWWGCLYDEARRNKVLAGPASEKRPESVRMNEWNDYRILCEGKRIQLWINGVQTVDYTEPDPNIECRGRIALQIQANRASEAWYRNIRIKVLDRDESP